jgi:hypothetical protein
MLEQDGIKAYRTLAEVLDEVRSGLCQPMAAVAALADFDPDLLWSWLSLRAANETRSRLGELSLARTLARLQLEADRNRGLLPTPVRKDLLLQDWLIQWSRLSA